MQPEREAVEKALQRMRETKLVGMEYFGSRDDTTRQVSLDEVDRSHFYIGIFGARYGSGITEDEYRRARAKGIPCRIYFKADSTIAESQREADSGKTAKLAALKAELKRDHTIAHFTSPDDLAAIATADFHNWLIESKRAERGEFNQLHTLPPRPTGFIGREADLAKLRALNPSAGAHLTGLCGMGGIGKTALALVLAHEWAARFPDAQLFLDARGTQADPPSARALMERVVLAFHPTAKLPDDDSAIAAIYRDVLGGKRALILLDNARDAAQAKPLIPPAGCALIVTSRQTFMLGKDAPHNVGRLPDDEAVALLREFAPDLTEVEAAALVPLCAGLPLALRLAGSHIALDAAERNGPPDIAGYILALGGGRLAHLDADAADAGEVTISETLRLSEARLPEAERAAWRALGVFTASFDARAAQAVAGADAGMLGHFVRRSLLEREGAERFKVHDLAAEYACAQLGGEALTALRLARARHYTAVSDEAQELYLNGDAVGGLALFDRERAHIEISRIWLVRCGDEDAALQMISLARTVVFTAPLRFHPREQIVWMENQLGAAGKLKHLPAICSGLGSLGNAYVQLGDVRKACEIFQQQLTAAKAANYRLSEGHALSNLGNTHFSLGDVRAAISFQKQALVIKREIGDRRGEGNSLNNLGNAYIALGNPSEARHAFEQALAIAIELGDRRGEGIALGNLGIAHFDLGDVHVAIQLYEAALMMAREIGYRYGESGALGNLGNAHRHLGDTHKAKDYYERRLLLAREIGDRHGEGAALAHLGFVHGDLGQPREALAYIERGFSILREVGDKHGQGTSLQNSALAYDMLGNRPEAIARAAAALEIYEAIEDPNAAQVRAALAEWRAGS